MPPTLTEGDEGPLDHVPTASRTHQGVGTPSGIESGGVDSPEPVGGLEGREVRRTDTTPLEERPDSTPDFPHDSDSDRTLPSTNSRRAKSNPWLSSLIPTLPRSSDGPTYPFETGIEGFDLTGEDGSGV